MLRLVPPLVACLAALAVAAPRDVSPVVATVLAKHHVPGLVGAVVELDGATIVGAAGVRKVGSPDPLLVTDSIHLGSDTKAMTATLVAQLVQSGGLKYETTLAEAFPAVTMDAAYAKVTVEQLLGHRAGLPANVAPWWAYDAMPGGPVAQRLRVIKDILANKPASAPGPVLVHSGSNAAWFCVAWLAPTKGFALLAATNAAADDAADDDAARACDDLVVALMKERGK